MALLMHLIGLFVGDVVLAREEVLVNGKPIGLNRSPMQEPSC
jgi:hypothetical protein